MSGPELASFLHSYLCAPHPHTCFHTPGSEQALSGRVLPCIYTLIDVYTHTHTGACLHILREAYTPTQTQRNVRLHTDPIEVCTHAHLHKHTYTSTRANQPATRPYAGTHSICTDSPLLLAPKTLSAQSHKGTQFGSLLSHGDSSVSLSFTGLSVSIIGTWDGSWDVRRRDSRVRPLCHTLPLCP